MSDSSFPVSIGPASEPDTERMLTFEYDRAMYALPIAEVHEVAEAGRICCVPTIPADQVGVMNWHGEALPVVAARLLFASEEADAPAPSGAEVGAAEEDAPSESSRDDAPGSAVRPGHVLVVSARDDEPARLGLPIDRVLGLVDGTRRRRGGNQIIVERRPLDGRVVNVIDPCRLVARATEVIGQQTA